MSIKIVVDSLTRLSRKLYKPLISITLLIFFSVGQLNAQGTNIPGDIVFVIDESGSMSAEQSAVQAGVPTLAQAILAAGVDAQFALIGYGDSTVAPMVELTSTANLTSFSNAVGSLTISGSIEPGYDGIILATDASAINQRPNTGLCVVIITDEPSNGDVNLEQDVIAALNSRNATLFGVLSGSSTVANSYSPAISASGGDIFSLDDLVNDTASLVTQIGLGCAEAIIQQQAILDITKVLDATSPSPAILGDVLSYTITAENTGDAILTTVVVEDTILDPPQAICATLNPGETCVLQGTYKVDTFDESAGSVVNTATAVSDSTNPVTATVTVPVDVLVASLSIQKVLDSGSSSPASVGDTLAYTVTAENDGDTVLNSVVVSDPKLIPAQATCATLDPGAVCELKGEYVVTAADESAGMIVNTASATSDQFGPVTDSVTVAVVQAGPELSLRMIKKLDSGLRSGATHATVGDRLTYKVFVVNNGGANLSDVVIKDSMIVPSQKTCRVLDIGKSCVLTGILTVTDAHAAAGAIVNTATAETAGVATLSSTHTISVQRAPAPLVTTPRPAVEATSPDITAQSSKLGLRKILDRGSNPANVGDRLSFKIIAVNEGSSSLTNVVVSDSSLLPSTKNCARLNRGQTCVLLGTMDVTEAYLSGRVTEAVANADQTDEVSRSYRIVAVDRPVPTANPEGQNQVLIDANAPDTTVLISSQDTAVSTTSAPAQECVDNDGDGWGWNGTSSCPMPTTQQPLAEECVDHDGDGWGWNGVESCIVNASSGCVDSDGDGWGWNGHSSCLVN